MAAMMQRQGPAEDDIYTILLIIAAVFLVIATVLLAYQFGSYYGFENLLHGPAVIEK
ncbi:MAG: hypothetical protein WC975_05065 [Phycisphaerae bacterium]